MSKRILAFTNELHRRGKLVHLCLDKFINDRENPSSTIQVYHRHIGAWHTGEAFPLGGTPMSCETAQSPANFPKTMTMSERIVPAASVDGEWSVLTRTSTRSLTNAAMGDNPTLEARRRRYGVYGRN